MGKERANFMREFKCAYHQDDGSVELYSKDDQKLTRTGDPQTNAEYMSLNDPAVLAAFVAFCSNKERELFLRGCTRNYRQSVPSLFRVDTGKECDKRTCEQRWLVYQGLLDRLRSKLPGNRWKRERLGAILQHYGIKTPWLDVVHDLHTAIWFANHEFETLGSSRVAVESEQKYGWISVYVPVKSQGRPIVADLWREQSSRHLRPHVQQGLSLAMQDDNAQAPEPVQDFKQHQVAQIRFPISDEWQLSGHMFSTRFLFPVSDRDDSLKRLSASDVQRVLVEASGELDGCGFGIVTHYC